MNKNRSAVIVGGGRVGRRTAAQVAESGYTVTVIEHDAEKKEKLARSAATRVVVGDGADADILQRADPSSADVVAALTNDTETNLAVCELADEVAPGARTIARISKDGEQDIAYLKHVDSVVYPAAAGASAAAAEVTGKRVR